MQDETTKQLVGHFESVPHIVCYGNSIPNLCAELFKSISIVANYTIIKEDRLSEYVTDKHRSITINI